MRKSILYLVAPLILLSCQNDSTYMDNIDTISAISAYSPVLLNEQPHIPSISNPKLQYEWENIEEIYLNGGKKIAPPWIFKPGNSNNIPKDFAMDIKKTDGWSLIFHSLSDREEAEGNYIYFYNKNRGVLKVFYFNPAPVPSQDMLWVLAPHDTNNMNIPSNELCDKPLSSTLKNTIATTFNMVESNEIGFSLSVGWNAFEFELNYIPTSQNNNMTFNIRGYISNSSEVKLKGTYSGEINIPSGSRSGSGWFGSLTKIIGGIGTVFGIPPAVVGVLLPKNDDQFFSSLEKGDKKITNLSKIMGRASVFFDKDDNSVYIKGTSKGNTTLNGSTEAKLGGVIAHSNDIDYKYLLNNHELGLWGLKKEPILSLSRYEVIFKDTQEYPSTYGVIKKSMDQSVDVIKSANTIKNDIIINPQVLPSIKDYYVKVTFNSNRYIMSSAVIQEKLASETYTFDYTVSKEMHNYEKREPVGYTFRGSLNNVTRRYFYIDRTDFFCNYKIYDDAFIYANVTITFRYNNNTTYVSSKNFKVKLDISTSESEPWADPVTTPNFKDSRLFYRLVTW